MWVEIKTDTSYRPGHPEDNTLLVEADSIEDALGKVRTFAGETTLKGTPKAARQVYYVVSKLDLVKL